MKLFDLNAYHLHQIRAKRDFLSHNFLYEHIGSELTSRLKDIKRKFGKSLNLSPHSLSYPSQHYPLLKEILSFEEEAFDLILSCLALHWVNDLPTFLKYIHRVLKENGLFLSAFWGGQTLVELRESLIQAEMELKGGASPRIAPMVHPSDAPSLLKNAGFFMPVVDTETIKVTYPSLEKLIKDLRGMGETNILHARPKTFTSKALFKRTEEIYRERYGKTDLTFPATFEVIYLTGWKNLHQENSS